MTKRFLLCSVWLFVSITNLNISRAADPTQGNPEQGTLGGTGHQPTTPIPDGIFTQPEIPERLEIPDVMDVIPSSLPESIFDSTAPDVNSPENPEPVDRGD